MNDSLDAWEHWTLTHVPAKIKPQRCDVCGEAQVNGLCQCPTLAQTPPPQGVQHAPATHMTCWWCGLPNQRAGAACARCGRIV